MARIRWRPLAMIVCCAVVLIPFAGCGPRYVPVSGTVTLDGKPLSGGVLVFSPDAAKGNSARISCSGPVKDGRYTLETSGILRADSGAGAPLGWYKVTLITDLPGQPKVEVNPKYRNVEQTPLSKEVVNNPEPGHYDIQLVK
jgi:hypothetical protein